MLDREGRGTCAVCGRVNVLIGMITWHKKELVCSWCYLNKRKLHELDRKNALIKFKKSNVIKLTMWD